MNNERHPAMTEITIGDPVPGLTVYTITCREASELPGPQQDIEQLQDAFWGSQNIIRFARRHPGVFGEVIANKRRSRGLTQYELSRIVGCSRTRISCLETGVVASSDAHAPKIIDVLSITVADLEAEEANHAQAA